MVQVFQNLYQHVWRALFGRKDDEKLKMFTKVILSIFGLVMMLAALFGVYVLPYLPNEWAIADGRTVADQIASVNYLLTYIAVAGAIGGIAFTVFGYYQATRIEKIVKDSVHKQMATAKIELERHKEECLALIQKVQAERDELQQLIKRFTDDNGYIKAVNIQNLNDPISSLHIHSESMLIQNGTIEHMRSNIKNYLSVESSTLNRLLVLADGQGQVFNIGHNSTMGTTKIYTGSDAPDSILKNRDLRDVIEEQMSMINQDEQILPNPFRAETEPSKSQEETNDNSQEEIGQTSQKETDEQEKGNE